MLSSVSKREVHDVIKNTGASSGALSCPRTVTDCAGPARDACVLQVTSDGIIAGCDSRAPQLLGWRREDLIGRGIDTLVFMPPDGTGQAMHALCADGNRFSVELSCVEVATEHATLKLVRMRERDSVWGGDVVVRPGTEVCPGGSLKPGNEPQSQALVNHAFRERLRQLLSQEGGVGRATLLFLTLTELDEIAEAHGRETAEMLCANVEARMNKCLRAGDIAACMVWDEFVAIIHDAESASVMRAVIDRINDAVRQPFLILGRRICISAPIGAELYAINDTNPHELLRHFDDAMQLAAGRRSGRDSDGSSVGTDWQYDDNVGASRGACT